MERRKFLYLTTAGVALSTLAANTQRGNLLSSEATNTPVNLSVDWSTAISETTPLVFGSNDYEIMYLSHATDAHYQSLLDKLNIPLIRIHHAKLSEK